jgi:hypothetical protein
VKTTSVADPRCLSQIPDPDFYPSCSRIQKQQQKRKVKKICCPTFSCSHKHHEIKNYFIFEQVKKKLGQFTKNIDFLPKQCPDPEKTYSKSRSQKGTGSRIQIRNTENYPVFL